MRIVSFLIAGTIPAKNDAWIIGDEFVNKIYHSFQHMRDSARTDRRSGPGPYLFNYYNISCFTPNPKSVLRDVLARLVNCFIKALNNAKRLPRLVIVIPEADLCNYINYNNFDMKILANKAINWIMIQMNRALEAKQENLAARCPGSILSTEPKFIWVEKFNRVNDFSKLMSVHYKYNEALQEQVLKRVRYYSIDVEQEMMDAKLFDMANNLNGRGVIRFWKEIDKQIQLFDERKKTLKPTLKDQQMTMDNAK